MTKKLDESKTSTVHSIDVVNSQSRSDGSEESKTPIIRRRALRERN